MRKDEMEAQLKRARHERDAMPATIAALAETKDLLLKIISLSPDDNSYIVALLRACTLLGIDMPECPVIDEIDHRNRANAEQAALLDWLMTNPDEYSDMRVMQIYDAWNGEGLFLDHCRATKETQ